MRLLLVDDSHSNLTLIESILRRADYQTDLAGNGLEAFELYKNGHYHLVLMDMEMPIMNGFEATAAIRSYEHESGRSATPIIAISAHTLEEDVARMLASGCNEHLAKPVRKHNLLQTIEKYQT